MTDLLDPSTLARAAVNGVDLAYFEMGAGPLALCLHGYPDTAHTWRHLLPELADRGFRAVAPFLRGYAPSGLAADGCYHPAASSLDANALHDLLGGDEEAVLIGHDWGAIAAYGAAGTEPDRWRRLVTLAIPPGPAVAGGMFSPDQLRRSWYMFFQVWAYAEPIVMADGFAHVSRLWSDWSPGYDATNDVAHFASAMPDADHVTAALSYYRQMLDLGAHLPDLSAVQVAALTIPPRPLLYLHGVDDGCMGIEIADTTPDVLSVEGSRYQRIEGAGHFLHLERPEVVDPLILDFVAGG